MPAIWRARVVNLAAQPVVLLLTILNFDGSIRAHELSS